MVLPKFIKRKSSDLILPGYLNQSLNDIEIKFDRLSADEHARFGHPDWSVKYGLAPSNLPRNRYRGVVPWDKTRVKLPVVEGQEANDYINASWVTLTPGGTLPPPARETKEKEKVGSSRSSNPIRLFSHSRSNSKSSVRSEKSEKSEKSDLSKNKDIEDTTTLEKEEIDKMLDQIEAVIDTSTSSSSSQLPNVPSKTYIVTQGPLNSTVNHFWQMVNAYCGDPAVIVMLTGLSEPYNGRRMNKCARYWPIDKNIPLPVSKGTDFEHDLSVRLVSLTQTSYYELRALEITNLTTGASKTAHHFYYHSWPDFGNPSGGADMVNFVSKVNNLNTSPQSPLVVHCSAGIGRSGTYLAIDAGITRGCWVNEDRDLVYDLVSNMREQRLGMVQKATQLEYIYDQLKCYIKGS